MKQQTWILVGGDTLLGREVRDLMAERKLPVHLELRAGQADERVITREDDELSVMEPLDAEAISHASVVLLATSGDAARSALALVRSSGGRAVVVDATGSLEDLPESRLRAPALEDAATPFAAGAIHTVVHPAASALSRLLTLLHGVFPIRSAVVTLFEPASARGKQAVDELHRQTIELFSFHAMPKEVFDTQASFNLLPRLGDEAPVSLRSGEQRIEKHLASMLGARGVPLPSLRLIHAPVFHGYCQSVWVEFESRPPVAEVEKMLGKEGVDVRSADVEPASNTGVAGQGGITVSDVAEDHAHPRAMWLWMASDNLRNSAENAILVAALAAKQAQSEGR